MVRELHGLATIRERAFVGPQLQDDGLSLLVDVVRLDLDDEVLLNNRHTLYKTIEADISAGACATQRDFLSTVKSAPAVAPLAESML